MLDENQLMDKLFHFNLCLNPEHQLSEDYRTKLVAKSEMLEGVSQSLNTTLNESNIETLGEALFAIAAVIGPRMETVEDVLVTVQTIGALLLTGMSDDKIAGYVMQKLLGDLLSGEDSPQ